MELEIKNQYENKLLKRKEIGALMKFDGATPSNDEVKTKLSAKLGGDKALVVIDHIYTTFGSHEAKIIAKIYADKNTMKQYEPTLKKAEEKEAAAKAQTEGGDAPAEQPAEEKKEEAPAEAVPAEEKKEEAPAEEAKPEEKPAEKAQDTPAEEKAEEPPAEEKKEAE
ncbi:30S ribosomal protein S24e [Candidatus Undinarchaeota archaeon]